MNTRADVLRVVVRAPESAADQVRAFLDQRPPAAEVWVERREGRVCALLSGDRGWLMWLRSEGDPGLTSRDPGYAGPPEAQLPFVLGNGQVDHYPAAWTIPAALVARALEQFAARGDMPGEIAWHDDGEGDTP